MAAKLDKDKYSAATLDRTLGFFGKFLGANRLAPYGFDNVLSALAACAKGKPIPDDVMKNLGEGGLKILDDFCKEFCPASKNPEPCDWCQSQRSKCLPNESGPGCKACAVRGKECKRTPVEGPTRTAKTISKSREAANPIKRGRRAARRANSKASDEVALKMYGPYPAAREAGSATSSPDPGFIVPLAGGNFGASEGVAGPSGSHNALDSAALHLGDHQSPSNLQSDLHLPASNYPFDMFALYAQNSGEASPGYNPYAALFSTYNPGQFPN